MGSELLESGLIHVVVIHLEICNAEALNNCTTNYSDPHIQTEGLEWEA